MSGFGMSLALLSPAVLAQKSEEMQTFVSQVVIYAGIVFVLVVALYAYFMRLRDKRAAPLNRIFKAGRTIHSVGPEVTVTECVRIMTATRIGALIVLDGEKLAGIFTERDALNKVLGAGLDPRSTKVAEVMTRDPVCAAPNMSVAAAMELVTKRRFRHLPIVENGRVLAVVSSGDLTHWLVKDQTGEVQGLVDLAARS
jgi:CBS domain-containing protein